MTWKGFEQQPGARDTGMTIKQTASRVGPARDIYLVRLQNVMTCPVSALSLVGVVRTNMQAVTALIQARQASKMYVFHDPDNPVKPLTAKSIKRQIVKALAKMDVHVELYEVQSLLDATSAKVTADKYNSKVGVSCVMFSMLSCNGRSSWIARHVHLLLVMLLTVSCPVQPYVPSNLQALQIGQALHPASRLL